MQDRAQHKSRRPRFWLVFGCLLGVVLAATSASYLIYTFVPLYEAKAWIRIGSSDALYPEAEGDPGQSLKESLSQRQTELVRTPLVLEAAVKHEAVAELPEVLNSNNPTEWLASRVEVVSIGGYDIYAISFTYEDPEGAASAADAIAEAYQQFHEENMHRDRSDEFIEALEKERDRIKQEIQSQRERVRNLTGRDPVTGLIRNVSLSEPLAAEQQDILRKHVELEMLKAELKVTKAYAATKGSGTVESATDAKLDELQAQLDHQERVLEVLRKEHQNQLKDLLSNDSRNVQAEIERAELKWQQDALAMINERILEMHTDMRFRPGGVTILREATVPRKPINRLPYLRIAFAVTASFAIGILCSFAGSGLVRRRSGSEQPS